MMTAQTIRRRGAILTTFALLAVLAALPPGPANAHTGEHHATAVAEGGSTLFGYNPPGLDPAQEFWLDGLVSVKHRIGTDGKDYYRGSFKMNSWRGVFTDDDTIWAVPGDSQAVDYTIRMGLYSLDQATGIITPLHGNWDSWVTTGNGWSYGCQGDGREAQVNTQVGKSIVARLVVRGERKFYYQGHWYSSGQNSGYHLTSSDRLRTTWWIEEPPLMGHIVDPDPLARSFMSTPTLPAATIAGYCSLWTTVL